MVPATGKGQAFVHQVIEGHWPLTLGASRRRDMEGESGFLEMGSCGCDEMRCRWADTQTPKCLLWEGGAFAECHPCSGIGRVPFLTEEIIGEIMGLQMIDVMGAPWTGEDQGSQWKQMCLDFFLQGTGEP